MAWPGTRKTQKTKVPDFVRDDFVHKTATCRFCRVEFDVMNYSGTPKLPYHCGADKKPCEGTGAPLEVAGVGHTSKIELDPDLSNSKMANFYEKEMDW